MTRSRSPLHQIIDGLGRALLELGAHPVALELERWAFAIHGALSAPGREFHDHEHVGALAISAGDPLGVIAALYHDAVYFQIDQGPPATMRAELEQVLVRDAQGWRVKPPPTAATADVLAVFGRVPGELVSPATGLNELASALVVALHLGGTVGRWPLVTVAMSIEQTIPFRVDPVPVLHARVAALGVPAGELAAMVRQAVRFGNCDVENFAIADPGQFLDSTWKLLPESNPSLQAPTVYSVRDYRVALEKMEGFLAGLPAARVFHAWDGEPAPAVHAAWVAQAAANLALAIRYLRVKLYAIAIVEALCDVTGGQVPLDYFMGGLAPGDAPDPDRIEAFLPAVERGAHLDPVLDSLLTAGRASESSFDAGPSPLAALLYATCTGEALERGLAQARTVWTGQLGAREFLGAQPAAPVASIARAAAAVVETRAAALRALADELTGS